jgi:hypothetical protein
LVALGVLPQDASDFAITIMKWLASGEEWTVKRLKALKIEFITTFIAKDSAQVKAPWVARHKDGTPKGTLKRFWTDKYYLKRPQVVIDALMAYSFFTSRDVTKSQLDKFISSAQAQPVSCERVTKLVRFSPVFKRRYLGWNVDPTPHPYWERFRSPTKRIPYLYGTRPATSIEADLEFASHSEPILEAYNNHFPIMEWAMPWEFLSQWRLNTDKHPFVGTISFIQEPGYKLRAVANPCGLVQSALEPLKEEARCAIELIPEDCTFDQEKGVKWCQKQLGQGHQLFSVDLTDATNLFPLEVQMAALEAYKLTDISRAQEGRIDLVDDLIAMFKHYSRSPWRLPNGETLVFTKGQPLGLGPSFFVFALAHNALLYALGGQGKYVILGDDIVIKGKVLYDKYMLALSEMGCKVSQDKTIASSIVAEFASRLILRDGILFQHKWRKVTRSNVIDMCQRHGPSFLREVPTSMKKVINAIAPIPKELGGLGWNPRGESLEARLSTQVGTYILQLMKEDVRVLRSAKSITGNDFLNAHYRLSMSSAREDFMPTLKVELPDAWIPKTVFSKYHESTVSYLRSKLFQLWSTRPAFGETIIARYPANVRKISEYDGYLPWYQEPDPWKTDSSHLYRVIAKVLKGERSPF